MFATSTLTTTVPPSVGDGRSGRRAGRDSSNVVYDSPNPNGHSGAGRPVDVVALRLRAPAGRVVAVGQRHLADVRGGSRPAACRRGSRSPASAAAMASGPASPGHPGQQDRGAVLGGPLDRQRPAADHDEDDRRPGRDDRLEQLLLAARGTRGRAGRGTRRSWSRRSGRSARRARRSRRRRRRAASTASAISSSVPSWIPQPRAWRDLGCRRTPTRMRVEDRVRARPARRRPTTVGGVARRPSALPARASRAASRCGRGGCSRRAGRGRCRRSVR